MFNKLPLTWAAPTQLWQGGHCLLPRASGYLRHHSGATSNYQLENEPAVTGQTFNELTLMPSGARAHLLSGPLWPAGPKPHPWLRSQVVAVKGLDSFGANKELHVSVQLAQGTSYRTCTAPELHGTDDGKAVSLNAQGQRTPDRHPGS